MAASFNDSNWLRQDPTFQGRVRSSLLTYCGVVGNEAWSEFHRARMSFVSQILNSPDTFAPLFASIAAADTTVLADATVGGTVAITTLTLAASQQGLVTDTHISNAVSANFNNFFLVVG